jgi:hypothetical protein
MERHGTDWNALLRTIKIDRFLPETDPRLASGWPRTLAEIGHVSSVALPRPYVDHPTPGSSAIRAIKQLTGERS